MTTSKSRTAPNRTTRISNLFFAKDFGTLVRCISFFRFILSFAVTTGSDQGLELLVVNLRHKDACMCQFTVTPFYQMKRPQPVTIADFVDFMRLPLPCLERLLGGLFSISCFDLRRFILFCQWKTGNSTADWCRENCD